MDQEALRSALRAGVVELEFVKHNGALRQMKATLNEKYLPDTQSAKDTSIVRSGEILTVWDVENNGWRSARIDSIKGYVAAPEETKPSKNSSPPTFTG